MHTHIHTTGGNWIEELNRDGQIKNHTGLIRTILVWVIIVTEQVSGLQILKRFLNPSSFEAQPSPQSNPIDNFTV